jgi:hypothetical protein
LKSGLNYVRARKKDRSIEKNTLHSAYLYDIVSKKGHWSNMEGCWIE